MDYKKMEKDSISSEDHVVDVNEDSSTSDLLSSPKHKRCCRVKKLLNTKITVKHLLIFLMVYYAACCVNSKFGITYEARRVFHQTMDKIGDGFRDLFGYRRTRVLVIEPFTLMKTYKWREDIENDPRYRSQLDKLDGKV